MSQAVIFTPAVSCLTNNNPDWKWVTCLISCRHEKDKFTETVPALTGSEDAIRRQEEGHKYITYFLSGHLYHLSLWCWTGRAVLVLSCLQRSSDQFLNGSETHPSAVRPVTPGVMWCTGRQFINSPSGQQHTPRLRGGQVRGESSLWPGRPSLSSCHNKMFPSVLMNRFLFIYLCCVVAGLLRVLGFMVLLKLKSYTMRSLKEKAGERIYSLVKKKKSCKTRLQWMFRQFYTLASVLTSVVSVKFKRR